MSGAHAREIDPRRMSALAKRFKALWFSNAQRSFTIRSENHLSLRDEVTVSRQLIPTSAISLLLSCALTLGAACSIDEIIDHSNDVQLPPPRTDMGEGADPGLGVSPGQPIEVGALADKLVIDGQVYQGVYDGGSSYEGLWGMAWEFRADDYPVGWRLAWLHSAKLLRLMGIPSSPNLVAAYAIKVSGLDCATTPAQEGCFLLNEVSALQLLQTIFPEHTATLDAQSLFGNSFERSAWAFAYYSASSDAMMRRYHVDPDAFYAAHPQPDARQRHVLVALSQSPWWEGFNLSFMQCAQTPLEDCFLINEQPYYFLQDHTESITTFARAMDQAPPHDVRVRWDELEAYWRHLEPLYPMVDAEGMLKTLRVAFELRADEAATISFLQDAPAVLDALIWALPLPLNAKTLRARHCAAYYIQDLTACP